MLKTIALAGATAALVIGSIAVAQTDTSNPNNNPSGAAATNPNGAATPSDQNATGSSSSANQYGANTSATTGERG